MEIAHILEELAYDMGEFPREAIEAAITKKKYITPYLLAILEDVNKRIDGIIEDDNYQGHLYAMYLLAQFREKKAYPLLLELFSFPGEIPHQIAGDILTEDLSRILASVCDDQVTDLMEMIVNPVINEYVRAACQSSLVTLVGCGKIPRKKVIAFFGSLLEKQLERRPSFVWDNLISCCCQLYPIEIYLFIEKAFEEKLINITFISIEDVATILAEDKETHLFSLFQDAELIEDTVIEMEKWQESFDSFPS